MFSGVRSLVVYLFFFFQAEDGIRYLVRSRGLGDVYKRQERNGLPSGEAQFRIHRRVAVQQWPAKRIGEQLCRCLLYTSDAADERSSVDLGGRRIIKKKNNT